MGEAESSRNLSSRSSSSDTHAQIKAENSGQGDCRMLEGDATIDTLNGNAGADAYLQDKTNVKSRARSGDRHRHRASRRSILKPVGFPSPILEAGSSIQITAFPTGEPDDENAQTQTAERRRSASEPALQSVLQTPVNSKKGKRKAEEVDGSPPDPKNSQHATFLIPESRRECALRVFFFVWSLLKTRHCCIPDLCMSRLVGPHLPSEVSNAPVSYRRKRVRLSDATNFTPTPSPSQSRQNTMQSSSSSNPGSWLVRNPSQLSRAASKTASTRSLHRSVLTADTAAVASIGRRRSLSEASIPMSALVAPHAPSITLSSAYHMRDPHKPPKVTPTEWSLRLKGPDDAGSPVQAWCFFVGFVLFPMWWIASFTPIPKTRRVGGTDTEKAVMLDDPQVEHGTHACPPFCIWASTDHRLIRMQTLGHGAIDVVSWPGYHL